MNIFDFAIDREIYMYEMYMKLSKKASSVGFKKIFEMMAQEEVKHIETFKTKGEEIPKEARKDYFIEAKEIFNDLKEKEEVFEKENEQIWLYCKIRDLEEENAKFYLREAEKTDNLKLKETYIEFAKEEKQHADMMEEIVQFVGRPLTWVSSAETSSLKTY